MTTETIQLFVPLQETINRAKALSIPSERKEILQSLIQYIQEKVDKNDVAHLNFICTHNSRRSQFSQIWAQMAADYFGVASISYSGGVEVTAFNPRAVASIKRSGFEVIAVTEGSVNLVYHLKYQNAGKAITVFSKFFDHPINEAKKFAAVMTCSHADENCPYIPGTEQRIPVRYEDPKEFDDTPLEGEKYDERSLQIASEMFHVFSQIQKKA